MAKTTHREKLFTNDMTRKRTTENDLVVSGGGAAAPVRRKAAARPRAPRRAAEPVGTPAPVAAAPEAVAPQADAASSVYTPSNEEIAALAYSYWESRGCQGGCPEEDWLRAERELALGGNSTTL
jgi:hypothetical protein